MIFDLMPLSSEKIYNSGEKRKKRKMKMMMNDVPRTYYMLQIASKLLLIVY